MEKLTSNGWKKEEGIPFSEVIAQKASECYTYSNPKNTQIAVLNNSNESKIFIRLAGTRGNNFNYFEISSELLDPLCDKLIAEKDNADINNYFNFYFALQAVGSVAIVAWEQWESNYR